MNPMRTYRLVANKTGEPIVKGDKVIDFRGEEHVVEGFSPPYHSGSSGRVHTNRGEYFPSVIDAHIEEVKS